mmetsp:Transcript_74556/g.242045  ORF Transcript_74556/g.242045 Transcript_74556/m.242045 type:complete len:209 (-) Transcript_74556:438-1064(-)
MAWTKVCLCHASCEKWLNVIAGCTTSATTIQAAPTNASCPVRSSARRSTASKRRQGPRRPQRPSALLSSAAASHARLNICSMGRAACARSPVSRPMAKRRDSVECHRYEVHLVQTPTSRTASPAKAAMSMCCGWHWHGCCAGGVAESSTSMEPFTFDEAASPAPRPPPLRRGGRQKQREARPTSASTNRPSRQGMVVGAVSVMARSQV